MKSGTTLLLELLDAHPELVVMPGDSHMINRIDEHRDMPYAERENLLQQYWVARLVNPTGQQPFWIMGQDERPYLDFLHYLDHWLERLPPHDRTPFLAVVLAFFCANPKRAVDPKLWIEKTPGNELKVDRVMELFPSARFIHILRDPRPNIASLRRLYEIRGWDWDAGDVARGLRASMESALLNRRRLGKERYHLLRYEDLLKRHGEEMKEIASFLGIKMHEILTRPTVNGLPAKSNSMFEDRQVRGKILSEPNDHWSAQLNSAEQKEVLATLYPKAKKFGYKWVGTWYYPLCIVRFISRAFRGVQS
jgi:hypothetical protein